MQQRNAEQLRNHVWQQTAGQYIRVYAPGHPLTVMKGKPTTELHRIVLYDKIGPGPHPCYWCGSPLEWQRGRGHGALEVDHLNGIKDDNEISNLVPACRSCNMRRCCGVELQPFC